MSSTLICVTPRCRGALPAMFMPAQYAWSAAFGWIALTIVLPVIVSNASAQSPAA